MKSEHNNISGHASFNDSRIDEALGQYGRAVPAAGLESRVAARLSTVPRSEVRSAASFRLIVFRRFAAGALAAAAAGAIVFGTVQHSHNTVLPPIARVPQSTGMTPSNGQHTPTHAIPQPASSNPHAPHSRAKTTSGPRDKNAAATDNPSSVQPQH